MRESAPAIPVGIDRISKKYGDSVALDSVSLDITAGEFLTLLGPSGSGKTTMLMIVAGFVRPDSGTIRFGGNDIARLPPHKRNIGVVFQSYALFSNMTVAGNVGYPLLMRGVGAAERSARVERALELVRLPGFGDRLVDQLSGGQMQRVALARAIVFEPRILLMDEPLSALDKKLRENMQIEIRRLHDQLGTTTIYVTHDQREALTMSDRIAVMNHGRIEQLATSRALYERPASRFVAEFIGESTFLPITMKNGRPYWCDVEIHAALPPASERVSLLIRPERLALARSGIASEGMNYFSGVLREVIFQGDSLLLGVELADGTMLALRRPSSGESEDDLPQRGQAIELALSARDAVLVADLEP